MHKILVIFCLFCVSQLHAQYCTPSHRFSNMPYFDITEIDSNMNVLYGSSPNWQGNPTDLLMDIYYPSNVDTMSKRPFILLIHGGAFIIGNKISQQNDCREFAKRGYVAATISYRLGWSPVNTFGQVFAAYRAQQDAHAAMRFISNDANIYGIDTSWMFIGGSSAGAITSLNMVYSQQADWNGLIPGIEASQGTLDTLGNSLTNTFTMKGIYNNWGAAATTFMTPDEMLPTISFHGVQDVVVNINQDSTLGGSAIIHDTLVSNGVCSELIVDSLGGHGIYNTPAGDIFRTERVSCFFKSIFCETCTSTFLTDSVPANCLSLSLTDTEPISTYHAYPNPFSDQLNISGLTGQESFELFNAFGQTIIKANEISDINWSDLSHGLYFLSIKKDQVTTDIIKLVKQ